MNKPVIWVIGVVALACLAAVTVLAALGRDTTVVIGVITGVVVPLLGGLLYGKVEAINQQTNGNTSRLISLVERQSDQLATMAPPPPPAPAGPTIPHQAGPA